MLTKIDWNWEMRRLQDPPVPMPPVPGAVPVYWETKALGRFDVALHTVWEHKGWLMPPV